MLPTDREIIERWRNEPGPLLPLLNDFYTRDTFLSERIIRLISKALRIPLAELFGTVSFYHHFSFEPPGNKAPRVCTGPICCLNGGKRIMEMLNHQGAISMPCAGRCDEPVPVLQENRVLVGKDANNLKHRPSPIPPFNPSNFEECIFSGIREPERSTLQGYQNSGGYAGMTRAIQALQPVDIIQLLKESQLTGRGGAGFPTGLKWDAVREAEGQPKSIVCNADEGEPGCFKDRAIMEYDPHSIIEGMVIAAYVTGATRGFIYIRYEYPEALRILEQAISESEKAGFLGDDILGKPFNFKLYLRRGGGAYICGEETSLLNSLEGKHPFPRNRPPYPVTHGFENLPTVVNNVETLVAVARILEKNPDWYRGLGIGDHSGTKVISLSGDVQRPGNYEVPIGLPLQTLIYDWAGGPFSEQLIQAVTMAGLSGGFLAGCDLDVTLDEPSLQGVGSSLASGGIMVFDDSRNMVEVAHSAMKFFSEESCGKCFPCRIGTQRLVERLDGQGPDSLSEWIDEVKDIGKTMIATSACGLGMAAPKVTESLLKYFSKEIKKELFNQEFTDGRNSPV